MHFVFVCCYLLNENTEICENFSFLVLFLKQLLLRNCAVDFVEICNVYV